MILTLARHVIISFVFTAVALGTTNFYPITHGFSMQTPEIYEEIRNAIGERDLIVRNSSWLPFPWTEYGLGYVDYEMPIGNVIQAAPGYSYEGLVILAAQQALVGGSLPDNLTGIAYNSRYHPAGWIRGDIPDTYTNLYVYTNWVDLATDAGVHTGGLRRARVYDPTIHDWSDIEDPMWALPQNECGLHQAGDILGPWLIDDLQKIVSCLDAFHFPPLVGNRWVPYIPDSVESNRLFVSRFSENSWSEAVSTVHTQWPLTTPSTYDHYPESHWHGYYNNTHDRWYAEATSIFAYYRWLTPGGSDTNDAAGIKVWELGGEVAMYNYGVFNWYGSTQFDSYGYDVAEGVYTRFHTAAFGGGVRPQYLYSPAWGPKGLDGRPLIPPDACAAVEAGGEPQRRGFTANPGGVIIHLNWTHSNL